MIDFVDEIAYNTADLDDGLEAKLLDRDAILAALPFLAECYGEVDARHPGGREELKFNEALKRLLDRLATDLIENTRRSVSASGAASVDEIRNAPRRLAGFSPAFATMNRELKDFLFRNLYNHPAIVEERDRSVEGLAQLFTYYMESPSAMPPAYEAETEKAPREQVVCDYIAGMTDHYLLRLRREMLETTHSKNRSRA